MRPGLSSDGRKRTKGGMASFRVKLSFDDTVDLPGSDDLQKCFYAIKAIMILLSQHRNILHHSWMIILLINDRSSQSDPYLASLQGSSRVVSDLVASIMSDFDLREPCADGNTTFSEHVFFKHFSNPRITML